MKRESVPSSDMSNMSNMSNMSAVSDAVRKTSKAVTFADSVAFTRSSSASELADSVANSATESVANSVANSVADSVRRRGFNLTPYDIDIIVGGTQSVLMLCVMYYLYVQSDEIVPRKQKKPEETPKK